MILSTLFQSPRHTYCKVCDDIHLHFGVQTWVVVEGAVLDVYDAFNWVRVIFGRWFGEEEREADEDGKEAEEEGCSVLSDLNRLLVLFDENACQN
ncbi:hypothetical protein CVT25_008043 [Psilocybe cyanescens]|uniref:Uncharacterized protein n=1 Tax=Psilocybe cyanescens TaxID=93625 RepID=A0A409XMU3_PSICY|nr:hypothetical protein CVT25_008043 [Psilocybe cyanescens]